MNASVRLPSGITQVRLNLRVGLVEKLWMRECLSYDERRMAVTRLLRSWKTTTWPPPASRRRRRCSIGRSPRRWPSCASPHELFRFRRGRGPWRRAPVRGRKLFRVLCQLRFSQLQSATGANGHCERGWSTSALVIEMGPGAANRSAAREGPAIAAGSAEGYTDLLPLISATVRVLAVGVVLADAGYDYELNHVSCPERLTVMAMTPAKTRRCVAVARKQYPSDMSTTLGYSALLAAVERGIATGAGNAKAERGVATSSGASPGPYLHRLPPLHAWH